MRHFTPRTAAAISLTVCAISVIFCIITMSVVSWVKVSVDGADTYTGLFLKDSAGSSSDVVASNCNSDMSDRACTYLKSAKASAIIAVLLGGFCCMYSYAQLAYEYRNVTGVSFLISGIIAATEFVFVLICIITFSKFQNLALDVNDDINVEYPPSRDSEYIWGFDLMIAACVFSFVAAGWNLFYACRPGGGAKRSASNEGLFGFERNV
jgi:hypothetical protein